MNRKRRPGEDAHFTVASANRVLMKPISITVPAKIKVMLMLESSKLNMSMSEFCLGMMGVELDALKEKHGL